MHSVEEIVAAWERERPDLDTSSMALTGRVERLARLLDAQAAPTLARFDLTGADFDVLATLRRAGQPFRLTPTELGRAMMISSGGTTKRLDRLEDRGLVARSPAGDDRRSIVISLTPKGRKLVDRAVAAHVEDEQRLLAPLTERERWLLGELLDRLLQ